MKHRYGFLVIAVALVTAACGGGSGPGSSRGLGPSTTAPTAANAHCRDVTLTSPEVGVTTKTITVTVVADVQNAFKPGLFKGSWAGVRAWADYMNANGGLACRKVIVKASDSHISPDDSKAAIARACGDSIATVGTTALFLNDLKGMNGCKDKAGNATGLPDIALVQTVPDHQCSKVSFAALPTNSSCPYSGSGLRTFRVLPTQIDYYAKKYGTALHGVVVLPKDTPSTISAAIPVFRGFNHMGVKSDAEFGMSGLATQPQYTQVAQAIKQHHSNFVSSLLDYSGVVLARKEATVQGSNNVMVWDCQLNCYDKRLITLGGAPMEGTYAWLSFLPFEDKGSNPELDAFLKYDEEPEAFGVQAWLAGEIFTRAVNDAIAAHNDDPNAVTRANVLTAIRGLHNFDANGLMAPTDVGGKSRSACLVGVQVQHGRFVRIDPPEPNTFDCDNDKPLPAITIDPFKEYKG
jgi:hypothetical protein